MNAQLLVTVRHVLKNAAEIDVIQAGRIVYRLTIPANDAPAYLRDVVHQYRHSGRVAISH